MLTHPENASDNVTLTPEFATDIYKDHETDAHIKTQWQVSSEPSFLQRESILLDLESFDSLTRLTLPEFILDANATYYWRVRFYDVLNGRSLWSDSFSFSTLVANPDDGDGDGVPDSQEVTNGTIDLNGDGNLDVSSSTYKMVTNGSTSLSLEASNNVSAVDCLKSIDPDEITDNFGKPTDLDFGLIQFKINVTNRGDTAQVNIYFSEPVGENWYKYDLINGWSEYSKDYPGNVLFSSDRRSVLLTLVDGGPGDSDGVENGIIVDPSGPGGGLAGLGGGGGDSGGSGCFIATAAFGSPMEKHVQVLKDFRDFYLLKSQLGVAFVKAYYRYSPPIADVVASNNMLRTIVRIGLMPLIVFGYVVIHTSPFQQNVIFLLMIVGIIAMAYKRIRSDI